LALDLNRIKGQDMTTREPNQKYLDTLLLYYEEEVEGEVFFAALAERFDSIDQ
jgi:hypothetical protein